MLKKYITDLTPKFSLTGDFRKARAETIKQKKSLDIESGNGRD